MPERVAANIKSYQPESLKEMSYIWDTHSSVCGAIAADVSSLQPRDPVSKQKREKIFKLIAAKQQKQLQQRQ